MIHRNLRHNHKLGFSLCGRHTRGKEGEVRFKCKARFTVTSPYLPPFPTFLYAGHAGLLHFEFAHY